MLYPETRWVNKIARESLNGMTQKSERFIDACKRAGIEPTRRQASKYRRGMGKARMFDAS